MSSLARVVRVVASVLVGLCARGTSGAQAGPYEILSSVEDAALMVHIEDGAHLRSTRCGRFLLELGGGISRFDDLGRRWREFARQMGMEQDEAFDALLGSSCGLVRDSLRSEGTWVVLSRVSQKTARRVLSGLRSVPKSAVEGVPVVAIESGRVHAAVIGQGRTALLVLGERTDTALFQAVVARARAPQRGRVERAGGVHLRVRGLDGFDADLVCDVKATAQGARVEASLAGAGVRHLLAGIPAGGGGLPDLPSGADALLGLAAFVDMRQFEGVLGVPGVVRTREDQPGLSEFGPAAFVRVCGEGGTRVQMGVQIRHPMLSADKGDALIASLMARLGGARMGAGDFGGLAPRAIRIAEVGRIEGLSEGGGRLAWTYRGPDARGRSWMLGEFGDDSFEIQRLRERFDEILRVLGTGSGRDGAVAIGWARVGELLAWAGSRPAAPGLARALGLIERVSVRVLREGPQHVRIHADLSIP